MSDPSRRLTDAVDNVSSILTDLSAALYELNEAADAAGLQGPGAIASIDQFTARLRDQIARMHRHVRKGDDPDHD